MFGSFGCSKDRDAKIESKGTRALATVQAMKNQIAANLPLGSSRKEVSAFLNKQGIPHSYVDEPSLGEENIRTVSALKRGVWEVGLVREDLQIDFKFDADGKLVSFSVNPIYTGP